MIYSWLVCRKVTNEIRKRVTEWSTCSIHMFKLISKNDTNHKKEGWSEITPFDMVMSGTKNAILTDDLCRHRCVCGRSCIIPPYAGVYEQFVEILTLFDVVNCITQQLTQFHANEFHNVDKFKTYFGISDIAMQGKSLMADLLNRGVQGWRKNAEGVAAEVKIFLPFYVNDKGESDGPGRAMLSMVLEVSSVVHPTYVATNVLGNHWARDESSGTNRVVVTGKMYVLRQDDRLVCLIYSVEC